jgi:hypothetical protein
MGAIVNLINIWQEVSLLEAIMAKKRKTRQQKIILQLKRELARERQKTILPGTKVKARQGAISIRPKSESPKKTKTKKADVSVISYNPSLIKRDLMKTAILALIVLSLEFVLYLKLR